MYRLFCLALVLSASAALAEPPTVSFKSAGRGCFDFDTGVVKGRLQADEKSQGIPTFLDAETGTELAYGGSNPGLLSYYRLLSANKRWGDTLRVTNKTAELRADGAVEIRWPAGKEIPIEVIAVYRWKSPEVLDLTTTVKPARAVQRLEVFLSSYFNKTFRGSVYVSPPRHAGGKPAFLGPEANSLVIGTYLAFPRDLRAAQTIYDGRWELGRSPVQWSVTRMLAAPVGLQRDAKSGVTFVLMSRPEDCFAFNMPYNAPADGVSGHRSMYLSLFGLDLEAGQSATAHTRLVVGRNISDAQALELYRAFIAEKR